MAILKRVFLALAAIASTTVALNETGFCFAKVRWLSDRELVDIAVSHEIFQSSRNGENQSNANFYARNKTCCIVDRFSSDPMLPGFLEAAFGDRYALVELFYAQPFAPPHEAPFYDASMGISACGKVGAWRGIDSLSGERPRDARSGSDRRD